MDNLLRNKLRSALLRKAYQNPKGGYGYNIINYKTDFAGTRLDDVVAECFYMEKFGFVKWFDKTTIQLTDKGITVIEKYNGDIDAFQKEQENIELSKNKLTEAQLKDIKFSKIIAIISICLSLVAIIVAKSK
jgi:hypothetical protein